LDSGVDHTLKYHISGAKLEEKKIIDSLGLSEDGYDEKMNRWSDSFTMEDLVVGHCDDPTCPIYIKLHSGLLPHD